MNDRNEKITLSSIASPNILINENSTVLDVIQIAYNHEVDITSNLKEILDYSRLEMDGILETFILEFIKEQTDEEAKWLNLISKLEFIGDDKSAILLLDKELGV